MNKEREITELDRTKLNKVTDLFFLVWRGDRQSIDAKTKWAFLDSHRSKVLVLKNDDDELISVRGAINWPIKVNEFSIKAFQFHGTCVHPQYRRQGIFSTLNNAFLEMAITEEYDLIFNVSVAASRIGYEKLGWKYLKGFRRLTKINKPTNLLKQRFESHSLNNSIEDRIEENINVIEIPKEFLDTRERIFNKLIHTSYTKEFLNWRLDNPKENYRTLQNEECIIIYKTKFKGGLKELIIGEFFLIRSEFKPFRKALRSLLIRENPGITYTYIFNTHPYYNFYLRMFFLPNPFNFNLNFGVRHLNLKNEELFKNKKMGIGFLDIDTF